MDALDGGYLNVMKRRAGFREATVLAMAIKWWAGSAFLEDLRAEGGQVV
jgi:hypothetical protein